MVSCKKNFRGWWDLLSASLPLWQRRACRSSDGEAFAMPRFLREQNARELRRRPPLVRQSHNDLCAKYIITLTKSDWNEEETMKRRTFLGVLTGTSLGVLSKDSFAEFAREKNTAQAGAPVAAQGPFETSQVEVSGNTVFVRRYGKGPAILMV